MNFEDLSTTWKVLSVMGVIFTIVCVALLILVILMFETDLVPYPILETPSIDILEDEFSNFLQEFEFGIPETKFYKHPVKDLDGNPVLDLMDISVYV